VAQKRVNIVFEPEREEIMEGWRRLKMGHFVLCTGSLLELGCELYVRDTATLAVA